MITSLKDLNYSSYTGNISSIRDVVQPGLHAGSCRPHEVLFISSWHFYNIVKEYIFL